MADRLRELIDLLLSAPPGTSAAALAERAHFSRDHPDRLLAAATGETPAGLRRRLLLERAAWQLAHGATAAEAATAAGYGSTAAFSRAFARAHDAPPSRHAGSFVIDAPNGIHFHPPAGLLVPGGPRASGQHDLADRMLAHHLARSRELFDAAAALPAAALERSLYGAVLSYILSYGAVRREALAAMLTELGAQLGDGDPINRELRLHRNARRTVPPKRA